MRALHQTQIRHPGENLPASPVKTLAGKVARLGEAVWFLTTLLLFLVMGPFSVIGVIYGLWILGSEENREKMAMPASCSSQ